MQASGTWYCCSNLKVIFEVIQKNVSVNDVIHYNYKQSTSYEQVVHEIFPYYAIVKNIVSTRCSHSSNFCFHVSGASQQRS